MNRWRLDGLARWLRSPIFYLALLALGLRLYGITHGLPYIYHPDAPVYVLNALSFGTGDFNPHWFDYPTFSMYVLFFLYAIYFVVGWLAGIFTSSADFAVQYFVNPGPFYLLARILAASLGAATVAVVYLMGSRLYRDRLVGGVAALIAAFILIHVIESHYAKGDIMAAFLMCLSLLWAQPLLEEGKARSGWWAGFLGGLALATKYLGALVLGPLVLAALWGSRTADKSRRQRAGAISLLALVLGGFALGFAIGSPYALVEWREFTGTLSAIGAQIDMGWAAALTPRPWYDFIPSVLAPNLGWPVAILALGGLVFAGYRHTRQDLFLMVLPVLFLLLFAQKPLAARWHYWIPLLLILAILAARLLVEGLSLLRVTGRGRVLAGYCAAALALSPVIVEVLRYDASLRLPDTRILAKEWIEAHIPPGTKIATEKFGVPLAQTKESILREMHWETQGFGPSANDFYQVDPEIPKNQKARYFRYRLQVKPDSKAYDVYPPTSVANLPLSYYQEEGVAYIVMSSNRYDRYYALPHIFGAKVRRYETLKREGHLLKEFHPQKARSIGPVVRIYCMRSHEACQRAHREGKSD